MGANRAPLFSSIIRWAIETEAWDPWQLSSICSFIGLMISVQARRSSWWNAALFKAPHFCRSQYSPRTPYPRTCTRGITRRECRASSYYLQLPFTGWFWIGDRTILRGRKNSKIPSHCAIITRESKSAARTQQDGLLAKKKPSSTVFHLRNQR